MKKLDDLLKHITIRSVCGNTGTDVHSLTTDSRQADSGSLFFAIRGEVSDGHDFIGAAVSRGAAGIVCGHMPQDRARGVVYIVVEDTRAALAQAANAFYGFPSSKLRLVGVTGTNGKTTTATLLFDLFRGLGYTAGLISTVIYRIGDKTIPSTHTTPDPVRLNAMLAEMVDAGCEFCFMEVSSHSVVQKRIYGLDFRGGIFTNLTHDHLDYHGTFAEYIKAKKGFFDALGRDAFALINKDDRNGAVMVQNSRVSVTTYSLRTAADYRCRIMETHFDGMLLNLDGTELWVNLIGKFNAYNILSVYGAARLLGADKQEVLAVLSKLRSVAGRFEYLRSGNGIFGIVDYAHTPDALKNVIETINEIRNPDNRLIVVAGCGGDRDPEKRPLMGRIVGEGADLAILTSDNPRGEDPGAIIDQMAAGIIPGTRFLAIADRREAIKTAVITASPGDIVLVAGKGHENYQEVKGVKNHFDDREELANIFKLYSTPTINPT